MASRWLRSPLERSVIGEDAGPPIPGSDRFQNGGELLVDRMRILGVGQGGETVIQ